MRPDSLLRLLRYIRLITYLLNYFTSVKVQTPPTIRNLFRHGALQMLLTYLLTCLLINSIQWRGGVRTTKCLWDDRPTVCILFIRDGVLEDWPRPRGHLEDKILWPWPRPCCPRTHPCAIILCLHSNIRLTSYQLYTSIVHNASSVGYVAMFYWSVSLFW